MKLRSILIAIVLLAFVFGGMVSIKRRYDRLHKKYIDQSIVASRIDSQLIGPDGTSLTGPPAELGYKILDHVHHHEELATKYYFAAWRPWNSEEIEPSQLPCDCALSTATTPD
jgi:hypothetical protein